MYGGNSFISMIKVPSLFFGVWPELARFRFMSHTFKVLMTPVLNKRPLFTLRGGQVSKRLFLNDPSPINQRRYRFVRNNYALIYRDAS
jgi:hypothetical protein